jgi:hypothetical protein
MAGQEPQIVQVQKDSLKLLRSDAVIPIHLTRDDSSDVNMVLGRPDSS